ncbi:MAG: lactate utilization protein, partial [Desulfovibrio sp.]
MTPKQQAYEVTASTIIKNLAKRRMEGFYCPDSRSAVAKALELMPKGCSIAWGGSATVQQTGLMEAIRGGSYQIIDRDEAKTPEEKRVMFSRIVMADYFLMSANAITLDGQLMNIDGNGNRV